MRDRSLFFSWCLAILSGAFFGTVFGLDAIWIVALATVLGTVIMTAHRATRIPAIVWIICFALGMGLSVIRSESIMRDTHLLDEATEYFTRTVTIEATVGRRTNESVRNTSYILEEVSIDQKGFDSINLLGRFSRTFGLSEWDRIRFTARPEQPSEDINGFDYRQYLLLRDIYATASVDWFTRVGRADTNIAHSAIRTIRSEWLRRIESMYPGETAILLEGILIGERAGLSQETRDHFARSGLSHIVAVSGSNITIVLVFLAFLFRPFPVWLRSIAAIVGVASFVLLVGTEAPVLRAACFGLVGYFVFSAGRRIRPISVLLAIATVFVIIDPRIIVYDMSFLLSFLATLGLVCFAQPLGRTFRFLPRIFALRESIVLTIAATIATLPIMMGSFGQFSLIAPLANMLVVPLLPFVMLLGFLSLVASFFSDTIAIWIGFVAWGLLDWVLSVVRFFGSLRFATFSTDLGAFSWVFLVGWYTVIGTVAVLVNTRADNTKDPMEESPD